MESSKYCIFCISIIKSLKKLATISTSHYKHGRKDDCNKRSQTFCFNFNWSKYIDEDLKHDIEFILRSNASLAENKINNDIEQSL